VTGASNFKQLIEMHTNTVLFIVMTGFWDTVLIILWTFVTKLCLSEDDDCESDLVYICWCMGYTFFTIGTILLLIGGPIAEDIALTVSGFVIQFLGWSLICHAHFKPMISRQQ